IDVERAARDALAHDLRRLVHHRGHVLAHDLLVSEVSGGNALIGALAFDKFHHLGVGRAAALALFVDVIPRAGLLPEPALLADPVRIVDLARAGVDPFGALALAHGPADVEPGEVAHRVGPHR